MNASEQVYQQLERFFRKIAKKFPSQDDAASVTDVHVRLNQDDGELTAFDDDGNEITRCVVDEWIGNQDDDLYDGAVEAMRTVLKQIHDVVDTMGILKPFSFVLEDEDSDRTDELYIADDDTIIASGNLMEGLDKDLDNFLDELMKE